MQRVDDVHAFPGHIACDAASRSELVVPIVRDGELLGVLDLDSPRMRDLPRRTRPVASASPRSSQTRLLAKLLRAARIELSDPGK